MGPGRPRLLPLSAVLAACALGLTLTFLHHPRVGAYTIGAAVLAAAALRLALSDRQVGLLAVRSRRIDVLVLGLLAVVIIVSTAIHRFPVAGSP